MTPPTPDLTALEQWARNWWCRIFSQEMADAILSLCETVRAQQAELTKWQTCSGCGETMDAPGHCSNAETEWNKAQMEVAEQALNARDAAVARADQAERERDALMVRVDQWRRMADREVTACVEMRSDRDAARAEVAQLQQAIKVQANAVRVIDQKERAEYVATKTLDSERAANERLTDEVERLQAEVAQARAERDEWQARATRAEIAQVEARMQDISERQAESVLQAIEDRGLVTWATERDILIRRAEQADATIATLRAELQAAQELHRECYRWMNALNGEDDGGALPTLGAMLEKLAQAHPTTAQEGQ